MISLCRFVCENEFLFLGIYIQEYNYKHRLNCLNILCFQRGKRRERETKTSNIIDHRLSPVHALWGPIPQARENQTKISWFIT